MSAATPTLSLAAARRIALAAQGFGAPAPATVTMRQFAAMANRLGVIQIDSVNVLARAHLMPLYSRLGPHEVSLWQRATARTPRRLVEAWAHEASFIPVSSYPLLAWRRGDPSTAWGSVRSVVAEHSSVVTEVLDLIGERGPMTASQVRAEVGVPRPTTTDWGWNWSVAKRALEWLFYTGQVAAAGRNAQFERRYDLPERVLPASVVATAAPTQDQATEELIRIAARSQGIATELCLRDYFRLPVAASRRAIARLVADGELLPVAVEGWGRPAYLHADARRPRRIEAQALLAPFDPLVFTRPRLAALFGMDYRLEIYTPASKRRYGYYVLPFLLGDQMVARVDLKADRANGRLQVRGAYAEVGVQRAAVGAALHTELERLAGFLGLARVHWPTQVAGDLCPPR